MTHFPLPVRLAAGLVATAVEQARDLPRLVVELPVTAVSQALQTSMRVQQKVTEIAIRGDRALGALRPVEDRPSWATFDDEEPAVTRRNGSVVTPLRPEPATPARPQAPAREEAPGESVAVAAEATRAAAEHDAPAEPPASAGTDTGGPNVLPGFDDLTIPQLRAKLRVLTVEDLRALLAWEESHQARPPFLTMLGNRIETVTG